MSRPGLLLRLYAFLVFPLAVRGSLVWWWRMHASTHMEHAPVLDGIYDDGRRPGCPYCQQADTGSQRKEERDGA